MKATQATQDPAPNEATPTLTMSYSTSVRVDAGWRPIWVTVRARPLGRGGLAEVVEVLDVDGEAPDTTWASRTGAKRQGYSPAAIAKREIGRRKRISAALLEDDAA